jgi:hypothetical protein
MNMDTNTNTVTGCPVLAILSQFSCPGCPAMVVQSRFSFPVVLLHLSCPSCLVAPIQVVLTPRCQVLAVLLWFPFPGVLSWMSCHLLSSSGHLIFSVLSRLTYLTDLSRRICPGLSCMSYPRCPVPVFLNCCPATVIQPRSVSSVLSMLSCSGCSVLSVPSFLNHPLCPV